MVLIQICFFYQGSVIEPYILFSSLLQMYGNNNYNTFRQNQASGNSGVNLSASRVGGIAYLSQKKDNLGSYRLNTYVPEERPPRSQETKIWDAYPTPSITAKEQTLHLSSIELRTEDYYLIRNKRLQQNEAKHLQRAIAQKCFNQALLQNQCYNLMSFSRQPPISNRNASNPNIYNRFSNVSSVNTNSQTSGNIFSANNNSQSNNNSNNIQNSNNSSSTNNQNSNYGNNTFTYQGINTNNGPIQTGNMINNTRMTSSNLMNNNSNNSSNNNNIFSNNSNNNNNQNSFYNNAFNNFGGGVHGNHQNNLKNNGGNNTYDNNSSNNNNNMINGNNRNNHNFMTNNSNATNSMNNNNINNNGNFNNISSNNSNNNINNSCNNQNTNNNIFSNQNNTINSNNLNNNKSNNIFNSQNNNFQGQNHNNYPINQPFQPNNQQNMSLFGGNSQLNPYMNQQTNMMGFNNDLNMLFESYSDITSVDRLYKQFGKNLLQLFSNLDDQRKQISSSQNNYASEYSKGYQEYIQPFFSRAFRKQREEITITVVQKKQVSNKQTHQKLMKRNQQPLSNESNMLPVQSRIKRQEEPSNTILNSPNKQFKQVFINNFQPGRKAPYSVFLEVKWLDKYKNANVDKVIIKKNGFYLPLFDYYNERDLQLLLHSLKEYIPIIRNDAKLIIDHQQSSFQNQIILVGVIEQRLINIDSIQYQTRFSSIRNGFINEFIICKKKSGNKTATIAWDMPIDYETLDFSLPDAFNLQLSEVVCDIPALNSKCRITFESLPPKINKLFKQLGKKTATQALKSFLDRKNQEEKIFELCSIHDDGSWTFIVHKFN